MLSITAEWSVLMAGIISFSVASCIVLEINMQSSLLWIKGDGCLNVNLLLLGFLHRQMSKMSRESASDCKAAIEEHLSFGFPPSEPSSASSIKLKSPPKIISYSWWSSISSTSLLRSFKTFHLFVLQMSTA